VRRAAAVSGELVYVHYRIPKAYAELEQRGIDNVATVLADLGPKIDGSKLAALSETVERPVVQRLGHLLDRLGHGDRTAPMLEALNARPPVQSTELDRKEARAQVLAVLRSLPEEYRLPLSLRYLGGADYETIQIQMGISNGSLRGLLHRGLKLLQERLPDELREAPPAC